MRDWKYIVEKEMQEGKSLELAWRLGTNLDWVWFDDDDEEGIRSCNVLYGLALKQVSDPSCSRRTLCGVE
jgi:hypothetical protein